MSDPATRTKPPRAALDYPLAPPTPDGAVVEAAPGILWARMPMPIGLDHINVYLLRGDHGWTLVDTGLNTERTRELWEHIAAHHLDGLPIEALVCTHWHYDHVGVAWWLTERFGIPLWMTLGEYFTMRAYADPPPDPLPPAQLAHYTATGMSADAVRTLFARVRHDPFVPPSPPCYQRLRAGDVLPVGTRRWRVVIGEGHSPEHACLYDDANHVLLAGDQLLPRITSNVLVSDREPQANPLALWLASMDRLDALAADTLVLPSHQEIFRGLHARTAEIRAHHQHQLDGLRDILRGTPGATAFAAMQVLFPRRRGAIDDMLALGETLAHLAWLRDAGELQRTRDVEGIDHYDLADSATPARASA